MSEASKSTSWSQWSEVSANGAMTPNASDAGTFNGGSTRSPRRVVVQYSGPPRTARANIYYEYKTFPRVRVVDSFGFHQEPADWYKLMDLAPGLQEASESIDHSIKAIAATQGAASKLALVLIFADAYAGIHPQFWKIVKDSAADELFGFVGAPDRYLCTINGLNLCCGTKIKNTNLDHSGRFMVEKNGDVLDLNGDDPTSFSDYVPSYNSPSYLGELPDVYVNVL